jgi:probable phosphoglycerate mutase
MKEIIYIARHATPDWTRKDLVYYLPPGPPLTELGQQEAQAMGAFLLGAGAKHFFASPLERCEHTARIAAQICGAPVEVHKGLLEWQPGDTHEIVWKRLEPVFARAIEFSQDGGPAVLVTHGGPVGALLFNLGMDEATLNSRRTYDQRNVLPPAGVWKVSRDAPGQAWEMGLVFKPDIQEAARTKMQSLQRKDHQELI